jgi:hypothetical protein
MCRCEQTSGAALCACGQSLCVLSSVVCLMQQCTLRTCSSCQYFACGACICAINAMTVVLVDSVMCITRCALSLFASFDHILTGNDRWTGQTRRVTIEGQQALLDSLQTSGDQEAIAQAEQKLEAVKVARKRQGDGGESILHI